MCNVSVFKELKSRTLGSQIRRIKTQMLLSVVDDLSTLVVTSDLRHGKQLRAIRRQECAACSNPPEPIWECDCQSMCSVVFFDRPYQFPRTQTVGANTIV